jgi:GT2 family glycosyltransferase
MGISIVLPTLIRTDKQFSTTIKCIELARNCTKLPFELIIVETETNYLEEYADKYIHFPKKTCSTSDINAGFMLATGDYVGLLTNDVYVSDGWLESLIETFHKKRDCGIATLASTQFNELKQPGKIEQWVWCSVFLTRNEYLKKHNYFDNVNFPQVWDDSDFVTKLCLDGLLPYKNYGCVVDHKVGMTEYTCPKHEARYQENGKRYNEKYKGCTHPIYEHLRLK